MPRPPPSIKSLQEEFTKCKKIYDKIAQNANRAGNRWNSQNQRFDGDGSVELNFIFNKAAENLRKAENLLKKFTPRSNIDIIRDYDSAYGDYESSLYVSIFRGPRSYADQKDALKTLAKNACYIKRDNNDRGCITCQHLYFGNASPCTCINIPNGNKKIHDDIIYNELFRRCFLVTICGKRIPIDQNMSPKETRQAINGKDTVKLPVSEDMQPSTTCEDMQPSEIFILKDVTKAVRTEFGDSAANGFAPYNITVSMMMASHPDEIISRWGRTAVLQNTGRLLEYKKIEEESKYLYSDF